MAADHRGDVGDRPRTVVVSRIDAAEGQRAQGIDTVQRAVAAAADVVDPAPIGELVAGGGGEQHVARGRARQCRPGAMPSGQRAGRPARRRAGAGPGRAAGRELEILVLLAAGMPNPRIAAELVVTLDTVKKHVSHLLGKLGAANRTEAVTRARQLGLIP